MPEIFDHNHDWIVVLLRNEPKESYICLPFKQCHLQDCFCISQNVRWSINARLLCKEKHCFKANLLFYSFDSAALLMLNEQQI